MYILHLVFDYFYFILVLLPEPHSEAENRVHLARCGRKRRCRGDLDLRNSRSSEAPGHVDKGRHTRDERQQIRAAYQLWRTEYQRDWQK